MTAAKYRHWFWLTMFLVLFLVSRLYRLTAIPVFGDEAIYVRWAQVIKNVDTLRFVPLTDGKQPLFMWLNAMTLKFFDDPLVSGRFISVLAGMGTMVMVYLIALLFFNSTAALTAASLYLIFTYTFFFDRLALADNLLTFFGSLSLLFSLLLGRNPRLDLSLILGIILGLAWITKSPAVYFVVLSLVTGYMLLSSKKFFFYPLLSASIAFFIYNLLRLGPAFHQLALRNRDYLHPFSEIFRHPLDPLIPHLGDTLNIYNYYLGFFILPLFLLLVIYYRQSILKNKILIILFFWWLLPILANSALAKVFTSRYILFSLPPFMTLFAFLISKLKNKYIFLFFFLVSSLNFYKFYNLYFYPQNVTLPAIDRGYLQDWTAGWGIKSAAGYLIDRSRDYNVIVGTEGYFGTLPDGLQIYTDSLPRLTVFGIGIDPEIIPAKLTDARKHGDDVYLLVNRSRQKLTPAALSAVELVAEYPKPADDKLQLYRLK